MEIRRVPMFDTMHYEERVPAAAEMNVSSFLPTTKEREINAAGLGNVHFYLSASTSHCKFLTSKTPVCDPVCRCCEISHVEKASPLLLHLIAFVDIFMHTRRAKPSILSPGLI